MIMVAAMAAVIWGIGVALGTPRSARLIMLLLLFVAILALQIALPDGHPLREATGGDPRLWVLLAAFAGLIFAYSKGLSRLKTRAQKDADTTSQTPRDQFSETELDRYSRHVMLREIGGPGQKALKNARVLVIGAGGLGSPALQYLAAAGVGTIGVIDDDIVENSNLQRQVIHVDEQIGLPKVQSAFQAITLQNPFVTVQPYKRRLTGDIVENLFQEYDVILDGTDNFETRYLVNKACVDLKKPLIAAALTQWEGQISVYDPAQGGPCYACVFPAPPDPVLIPTCAEAGVVGPLPGVIGTMMAIETIKEICGVGDGLKGRIMIYDALYSEHRTVTAKRRANCAVCGTA